MEVEDEVIPGGALGKPLDHLDGRLVVAVHEVYLEPLDAQAGIVPADGLKVLVHDIEHGPQHDAHFLAIGIGNEAGQMDVVNGLEYRAGFGVIPSLVQDHVFQMVAGSEVDIVFVGFVVDAGLKADPFQVPVVPPVPRHLSGLYPRGVAYSVGPGQRIYQVVDRHLTVVGRDGEDAPRVGAGPFDLAI